MRPSQEIIRRNIPDLLRFADGSPVQQAEQWPRRRAELLNMLQDTVFGHAPAAPEVVTAEVTARKDPEAAGKAVREDIRVSFDTPKGPFSFPFTLVRPKKTEKPPVFLLINFENAVPNKYYPMEELIDNGYAVAQLYYEDVTEDNCPPKGETGFADPAVCFTEGLAVCYPRDPETGWGKIGMWAWAASRVMDVLCQRDDLDLNRVAVVGHSRLGKTALWCSAQDERFSMAVSNDSGCGGAALFREKEGEKIEFMKHRFPFWFCGRYSTYANREQDLPTDQHALLAMTAPRGLLVNSASLDAWADPVSEYLSTRAASPVFELLGKAGLQAPDRLPEAEETFLDGTLAYTMRDGTHYFSRTDWHRIMAYREKHGL